MNGYTETILKYASDDSHAGLLDHPDGVGEIGLGAEAAGQKLAVRFTLKCREQRVETLRYQVFGCGFTMAACAAVAELAEGEELAWLGSLDARQVDARLGGLPQERGYCAEIAVNALQAALDSVQRQAAPVARSLAADPDDHGPRLSPDDACYRALIDSSPVPGIPAEDRQLFACLLSVAAQEEAPLHQALGISQLMLDTLLLRVFPAIERTQVFAEPAGKTGVPPEVNPEVRELLLSFVSKSDWGWTQFAALLLARVIAARAAHPGHLWVAMGLFERPQLSAAIGRHLPALLAANHKKMRWKRFLFKQVCDLNGGMMCKTPDCGLCSDYALCFAPEEG